MIGVAISGKLASGKSTAAGVLERELGFVRLGLADELKRMARETIKFLIRESVGQDMLGTTLEEVLLSPFLDKTTPKGRAWLQFFGTDLIRRVDGDFWVRAFLQEAVKLDRVVTDDVRFTNEAYALRDAGFNLVRIRIPPEDQMARLRIHYPNYHASPNLLEHESETQLDSWPRWDAVFDGAERKEDFERRVIGWARGEFGLP